MNEFEELDTKLPRPAVFDCHAHLGPSPLRDGGLGLGQLLDRCAQQRIAGVIDCLMYRDHPLDEELAARWGLGQGRPVQLRFALGFPPPCQVETLERWEAERAEALQPFLLARAFWRVLPALRRAASRAAVPPKSLSSNHAPMTRAVCMGA